MKTQKRRPTVNLRYLLTPEFKCSLLLPSLPPGGRLFDYLCVRLNSGLLQFEPSMPLFELCVGVCICVIIVYVLFIIKLTIKPML